MNTLDGTIFSVIIISFLFFCLGFAFYFGIYYPKLKKIILLRFEGNNNHYLEKHYKKYIYENEYSSITISGKETVDKFGTLEHFNKKINKFSLERDKNELDKKGEEDLYIKHTSKYFAEEMSSVSAVSINEAYNSFKIKSGENKDFWLYYQGDNYLESKKSRKEKEKEMDRTLEDKFLAIKK